VDSVRSARRGLVVFFALVVLGTAIFQVAIVSTGKGIGELQGLVFLLMWVPAAASLVSRLVLHEGVADVSFRFGGRVGARMLGLALVYPLVVGGIAYGVAWSTGLAVWSSPVLSRIPIDSALLRFLARLVLNGSIGTVVGMAFAFGEELGWRGYMLTRLIDARLPRPVLLSGVLWGLWHAPLILTGQYAAGPYPALSVVVFGVDILAAAYLFAYVRLRSGSVWPAVLAHASWNAIIQGVFDRSTANPGIWVGESGVLVALANILVVAVLVRGPWPLKRYPADDSATSSRAVAL
jgi:uncharacterized protein